MVIPTGSSVLDYMLIPQNNKRTQFLWNILMQVDR